MKRKIFLGIIFLAIVGMNFTLPGTAMADDLIVIGNRSVPVSTLTQKEVKMIYLGKQKIWDNGLKVTFVKLKDEQSSKRFLKHFVKKNPSMYKRYWKKQAFIGGGNPPKEFGREKDLVQYVSKTKGAVGFISSKSYIETVKILSVMH